MCISTKGLGSDDRYNKDLYEYGKDVAAENNNEEGIIAFLNALKEFFLSKERVRREEKCANID